MDVEVVDDVQIMTVLLNSLVVLFCQAQPELSRVQIL